MNELKIQTNLQCDVIDKIADRLNLNNEGWWFCYDGLDNGFIVKVNFIVISVFVSLIKHKTLNQLLF